jgi:hypothetical protein
MTHLLIHFITHKGLYEIITVVSYVYDGVSLDMVKAHGSTIKNAIA